mmetsp:Transcript_11929/g.34205  ORF Transcript_11929/g.34205 Transcript_11929/m.34205 type:complete len:329 (+) Transcript_11929:149-1135(+)
MALQQETTIDEEWNNIVAQSEHDAALAAIESSFNKFQSSYSQDNQENPFDQEMIQTVYEATKESLVKNIKRVVRPINDDHYSDYVDQYHVVLDDEESEDDHNGIDLQREPLNELDNQRDEEEQEIDEEELVDKKAWKDAQELRRRIRAMAGTVQSVRERVLRWTEEGISSAFSTDLVDAPIQVRFDGEDNIDNKEQETKSDASNDVGYLGQCNTSENIPDHAHEFDFTSLQDSLKNLTELLEDTRWKRLPTGMKSLQETIESIEKETSEHRIMSQTEIAITTRCKDTIDQSARQKLFGEHFEQDGLSSMVNNTMNPMDRLALFGQTFS